MLGKISLKQVNHFLFFGVLVVGILYFAKKVLIPLMFSIFFAMLFAPLSNRMEKKGFKRAWSALISILIIVIAVACIGSLVYMQSKKLADRFPEIEQKSETFFKKAQQYVNKKLKIPLQKQDQVINEQMNSGSGSIGKIVKTGVAGIVGIVGSAAIVLVLTFLLLYQREKYEAFFVRLCTDTNPEEAKKVITRITKVAQNYLTGRVISILIFTVLFTVGFVIIGLDSAFLLAFIAALLTIVPYVGSIIGGLFPFAVALVTEDSTTVALGALAVVAVIQVIDNYFIEPYIIGGEVNISAFFTIVILLIGGLLWGVAGMVLFLPMLGVAKIVFDEIPSLKPYGFLVGDQQEEKQSDRLKKWIKKRFGKKKD